MMGIPGLDGIMEEMRGFQSELISIMGDIRESLQNIEAALTEEKDVQ